MLDDKLVKKGMLEKKYVQIMQNFYKLSRGIMHRQIQEISGKQYDVYLKDAKEFVDRIEKIVERRKL